MPRPCQPCLYCSHVTPIDNTDMQEELPWLDLETRCRLCRIHQQSSSTLEAARRRQTSFGEPCAGCSSDYSVNQPGSSSVQPEENPLPEPIIPTDFEAAFDSFRQFMSFASKQCGRYHGSIMRHDGNDGNREERPASTAGIDVRRPIGTGQSPLPGYTTTGQRLQHHRSKKQSSVSPVPTGSRAKTGIAGDHAALETRASKALKQLSSVIPSSTAQPSGKKVHFKENQRHGRPPTKPSVVPNRADVSNSQQSDVHSSRIAKPEAISHAGACSHRTGVDCPAVQGKASSPAERHFNHYHSQRRHDQRCHSNPLHSTASDGSVHVQVEPGTYAVTAARWGQEGRRHDTHIVNLDKEQCVQLTFAL